MLLFTLLYAEKYWFYKTITNSKKHLTTKQKAHILTIKTSLGLFIASLSSNFNILPESCVIISLTDFIAYLFADMKIGYKEYPEYLNNITGYFHHSVYVIITLLSFYTNTYNDYFHYFVSELPTFLLAIGKFNKRYRNNILFGETFFYTRIVYHILLSMKFRNVYPVNILSTLVLILHVYWFSKWCKSNTLVTWYFIKKRILAGM